MRYTGLSLLFWGVAVLGFSGLSAAQAQLQPGDILFHTSTSGQSKAVELATGSAFTHCGIVFLKEGQLQVLEAVQPVRYTPLASWIKRGEGSQYSARRLKAALDGGQIKKLQQAAESYLGKNYDLTFEWSDSRIYCSELVWKSFNRAVGVQLGELQKLKEFNLKDPIVKATMQERYGNKVPYEEPVISPASIYRCDQLVSVK